MEIRPARPCDLPEMQEIYRRARAYMAANGNPTQWGDSWPATELLEEDIALGRSYLCWEGERILAVFALLHGTDPTYVHIEGSWPDDGSYAVVHRMATAGERTGAGEFCLRWSREQCRQLRIDTHEANLPMRNLLEKMGFRYSGIIYVWDGSPRLAYYLD